MKTEHNNRNRITRVTTQRAAKNTDLGPLLLGVRRIPLGEPHLALAADQEHEINLQKHTGKVRISASFYPKTRSRASSQPCTRTRMNTASANTRHRSQNYGATGGGSYHCGWVGEVVARTGSFLATSLGPKIVGYICI